MYTEALKRLWERAGRRVLASPSSPRDTTAWDQDCFGPDHFVSTLLANPNLDLGASTIRVSKHENKPDHGHNCRQSSCFHQWSRFGGKGLLKWLPMSLSHSGSIIATRCTWACPENGISSAANCCSLYVGKSRQNRLCHSHFARVILASSPFQCPTQGDSSDL